MIDGGLAIVNGMGVSRAIRVTATRALRLRQQGQDTLEGAHLALETALRLLTGLATALTTRFLAVLGAAGTWFL